MSFHFHLLLYAKKKSICQEPPVKDWWHGDATLRVVLEHLKNEVFDDSQSS